MILCKATGKRQYHTKDEAEHVIFLMWAARPSIKIKELHVYKCPYCGLIHVGHDRKEQNERSN